ncbi:MAG: hypothetical protein K8T89_17145 [Planctomycetes bacterium]|nr:hypothetical protein [Planctomycetota bacterium]
MSRILCRKCACSSEVENESSYSGRRCAICRSPYPNSYASPADREARIWHAPPETVDHSGREVSHNILFFAEPPPEIGRLLSAASTLTTGTKYYSFLQRITFGTMIGLVVAALPWVLVFTISKSALVFISIGAFCIVLFYALVLTLCDHSCSFVGEQGIARYRCRGTPKNIVRKRVLKFSDASELHVSVTRIFTYGAHTATQFKFRWSDQNGKSLMQITSPENEKPILDRTIQDRRMPDVSDYSFCIAAEAAWSRYLLKPVLNRLKRDRSVTFNLKNGTVIEVGEGWIDFIVGNQSNRFTREELASAKLNDGEFEIKAKVAIEGWFRSTGIFRFSFKNIANASMFILLFEKLVAPDGSFSFRESSNS